MATVDSDKVVCGGTHAMTVAVLVYSRSRIWGLCGRSFKFAELESLYDNFLLGTFGFFKMRKLSS
jgi:hypothetical protein